jgi:hypothetical protein
MALNGPMPDPVSDLRRCGTGDGSDCAWALYCWRGSPAGSFAINPSEIQEYIFMMRGWEIEWAPARMSPRW